MIQISIFIILLKYLFILTIKKCIILNIRLYIMHLSHKVEKSVNRSITLYL